LKSAIFRAAEFQFFDPNAEGGAISGLRHDPAFRMLQKCDCFLPRPAQTGVGANA
jgi:hypothetical protein